MKTLNFAVIGCSHMGRRHMQGIVDKGACLYALCDTASERLEECRKDFNVQVAVSDYRELLSESVLDAVVIVTPDQLHRQMVVDFLMAGKDVLCEKPMALNLADCEAMMRAEKESGRRLMIGQVCRCTPGFIAAKELIDAGRIGELTFVESEYAHNYTEARGYNDWRVVPERHGFIGGGCHPVDLLRWIAGDPTEVYALSNHKSLMDWPMDDTTVAIYRFPNNVAGKVFVSIGCKRDYTMRSVFYGTMGTIICDNTSSEIYLYEDAEGKKYTKPEAIPVKIDNHNVTAEIDQFVDALLGLRDLPVTSMEGAASVAVCCATVESAAAGKPVEIKYPKL